MWSAWLSVAGYAALIFALSSIPHLDPPRTGLPLDKVAHFTEYFVLGALLVRAWGRQQVGRRALWRVGLTVLVGAIIALLDELYQGTVGRDRSGWDWLADFLGLWAAAAVDALDRRRPVLPAWFRRGRAPVKGRETT